MPTLQEAMDAFIRHTDLQPSGQIQHAEQCMEKLTIFLIHYSDLFDDREFPDEGEYAEWEENLDAHMNELLQGDIEPTGDLGQLPLTALDPEHLRDFLGWFLLRESGDAEQIKADAASLSAWLAYIHACDWWDANTYRSFSEILAEVTPSALRAARLSQVLFYFVRSGAGIAPRLRGQHFSCFVEGHGRVSEIGADGLFFSFENKEQAVGPVLLPQAILDMVEAGDVFDVEMGLRDNSWAMVDIGPVYPGCVYVEVEAYQGLEKIA